MSDPRPHRLPDLSIVYSDEPRGIAPRPAAKPTSSFGEYGLKRLQLENERMAKSLEVLRRNRELRAECAAAGIHIDTAPRTMEEIASEVAWRHGMDLEDIQTPERLKKLSRVRQEAMHHLYEERESDGRRCWSLPEIGKFFGGRHHTTILHGIRAHLKRARLP